MLTIHILLTFLWTSSQSSPHFLILAISLRSFIHFCGESFIFSPLAYIMFAKIGLPYKSLHNLVSMPILKSPSTSLSDLVNYGEILSMWSKIHEMVLWDQLLYSRFMNYGQSFPSEYESISRIQFHLVAWTFLLKVLWAFGCFPLNWSPNIVDWLPFTILVYSIFYELYSVHYHRLLQKCKCIIQVSQISGCAKSFFSWGLCDSKFCFSG